MPQSLSRLHMHLVFSTKTRARVITDRVRESLRRYMAAIYAVFAVEPANVVKVREYIANQREHHHIESFQDEYRRFLTSNGVKYDERYMWD